MHKFKRDLEVKRLEKREHLCILWKTKDKLWNICFHRQYQMTVSFLSKYFHIKYMEVEVLSHVFWSLVVCCCKVFEFWRVKVILKYCVHVLACFTLIGQMLQSSLLIGQSLSCDLNTVLWLVKIYIPRLWLAHIWSKIWGCPWA